MSSCNVYTDEQLLSLLKSGDEAAYTELYNRYWNKLYVVALHRLDNKIEAEEIVQEIFYKVWKNRESLQLTYSINTYLGAAVKYAVINAMAAKSRQLKAKERMCKQMALLEQTDAYQLLEFSELRDELLSAMKGLPEKCRNVFLMSREEGKTYKEIAEELNISEKTVEFHISAALKKMKNALQQLFDIVLLLL